MPASPPRARPPLSVTIKSEAQIAAIATTFKYTEQLQLCQRADNLGGAAAVFSDAGGGREAGIDRCDHGSLIVAQSGRQR